MSTAEQVLEVLAEVAEVDEVYRDPDLRLYDLHILDSMSTVQLLIALSERLGVELSSAEFDPQLWATPCGIVAYMEQRVGA